MSELISYPTDLMYSQEPYMCSGSGSTGPVAMSVSNSLTDGANCPEGSSVIVSTKYVGIGSKQTNSVSATYTQRVGPQTVTYSASSQLTVNTSGVISVIGGSANIGGSATMTKTQYGIFMVAHLGKYNQRHNLTT